MTEELPAAPDGETAIMARPRPGAYLLESVGQHCDYWIKGGREHPDRATAVLAIEQAANAWKNAAYDLAEKLHWSGYLDPTREAARSEQPDIIMAAQKMLSASDQFVRETGLKHGDLITDAAEELRRALKNAAPQSLGSSANGGDALHQGTVAASLSVSDAPKKLWLWRNFVDGRPEYWAFDNPFPIHLNNGDPQTLGEPCAYAIVKPSRQGRTDVPEAEVIAAIKRVWFERKGE